MSGFQVHWDTGAAIVVDADVFATEAEAEAFAEEQFEEMLFAYPESSIEALCYSIEPA